ncbi:MAG TPA: sulfite exporter TauE/SafE family protein [Candidatus Dormibacteraeota bacterium]|nr:sulfite exporter TauE/SafE family protein [Candidatus Dormibacteraeota bacterium]
MPSPLLLTVIGAAVGTFGTLVGAGGGFVLVPLLALLEPTLPTNAITAMSLAVVAMNATSGAIAYARHRRIDYHSGLIFAIATLPGSIGGAYISRFIGREVFDLVFAALLIGLAIFVVVTHEEEPEPAPEGTWGYAQRSLVDAGGTAYRYSANIPLGIALSFGVGFASSLLGIGGGVIHVPALVGLLGFPTHVATATSHFVLAIMATVATVTHVGQGDLNGLYPQTILLGVGAIVGAQLGARLSARVHGRHIVRVLAVSLIFVGLRLAAQRLFAV